ncbi:MAG: DUF3365 domain-containing protein [Candidatus Thiodiazotropha taylori]
MIQSLPRVHSDKARLKVQLWLIVFGWSLMVLLLLLWSLNNEEAEMLELARQEAINNFNKDQVFRVWAATHGGVYVPITERTQPSPHLKHIPERDLVTPSGRRLTLMNPAFMLRQMMDDYADLYGVRGRITSIKPLNPDNAPDDWEWAALKSFERGEKEQFELTDIDVEPYLIMILQMKINQG